MLSLFTTTKDNEDLKNSLQILLNILDNRTLVLILSKLVLKKMEYFHFQTKDLIY